MCMLGTFNTHQAVDSSVVAFILTGTVVKNLPVCGGFILIFGKTNTII